MRKTDFMRLKEISDEDDVNKHIDLQVGDKFLYGTNIIDQKTNKFVGQQVTYYQVIKKNDRGIEYVPVYDLMEKDYIEIKGD